MDLTRLNRVILYLHRAGREAPPGAFQKVALELIGEAIAFDSAWWGNASDTPLEIHHLYLHNCDDSILETYQPVMGEDFMRQALMANPGRTINLADLTTRARLVRTALYRQFGRRYKIEWSLGTLLVEPVSSLNEFLTLWRHDAHHPFSEIERLTKELLMAHVADAHRTARLRQVLGDARRQHASWAVADDRGYLREATAAFAQHLKHRWPDWHGSRLPDELLPAVRAAKPVPLGRQRLLVEKRGRFWFLQVAGATLLDGLSPREREIAERYALGDTHAAIASALRLSPATVRNHIARCYRKLAVGNKAELARRVLAEKR